VCQKKKKKEKAYNLHNGEGIITNCNGGLKLWQFRTLDYSDVHRNYKGDSCAYC
jgi:hypothetical protein